MGVVEHGSALASGDGPRPGEVWLVGAGPGDPGLLTVRAAESLRRADLVLHDALPGRAVGGRGRGGGERGGPVGGGWGRRCRAAAEGDGCRSAGGACGRSRMY